MKKIKAFFKNKFTYFDLFLGIAFFVLVVGIYLFFYRKNEYVNIRIKITDQDVLYSTTNPKFWYANRFEIGDTEKNELGKVVSEIINVETFYMSPDTKSVYLDVRVKAVLDRKTKLYSAKGTNLVFGNTIKFSFPNASFYGLITESPNTSDQKGLTIGTRRLTLIQRGGWEPEVLKKIKKGDKVLDSKNNVLAEVISVNLEPAQVITQNYQGDLLVRHDPFYKDITMVVDVRVKNYRGEEFAFDNVVLRLGGTLPLNFQYASIWPIIIDIK